MTHMRLNPTFIFAILIAVAPLGVAGQNMGLGLSILLFAIYCIQDRGAALKATLQDETVAQYFAIWSLIVTPIFFATLIKGEFKEATRFILGYTLVLPMYIIGLTATKGNINYRRLINLATLILSLIAAVSLSQSYFGWKFDGLSIQPQIHRAQGFYSHPLTLAYATLTIMPIIIARFFSRPKSFQNLLTTASVFCIIFCSQSLTVIALTCLMTFLSCISILPRKKILLAGLATVLIFIAALTIQNPISRKFEMVISGQRSDHETPYFDDRIAFWHAHWVMFQDAPLLGHGAGITRDIRQPYYAKIGLGHISRMYEAHNMYLQNAVEGGVISVIGVLCFFSWWYISVRRVGQQEKWLRLGLRLTPVLIALGGLTQNALQDSEVRYMILLVCSMSFLFRVKCLNFDSHADRSLA